MKFTSLLFAVGTAAAAWSQTPGNIEAAEYDPTQDRWFISNNTSLLVTEDAGATYAYFGSATATEWKSLTAIYSPSGTMSCVLMISKRPLWWDPFPFQVPDF
jgi:hypothetical protein